jgi:hypothetical protein
MLMDACLSILVDLLLTPEGFRDVVVTGSVAGWVGSGMAEVTVTGSVGLVTTFWPSELYPSGWRTIVVVVSGPVGLGDPARHPSGKVTDTKKAETQMHDLFKSLITIFPSSVRLAGYNTEAESE